MKFKMSFFLAVLAPLCIVACGTPGAPQPPALELPRRVQDLRASRKADKVTLTWTTPRETTERTRIKHWGLTRICQGVGQVAMAQCAETVGTLSPAQTPPGAAATFVDTLSKQLQESHPVESASYAVELQNTHDRSAGLSNQVVVPLAPTLPPPDKLLAEVTAEGVAISWVVPNDEMQVLASGSDHLKYELRIYRRDKSKPGALPADISTTGAVASPKVAQPNINVLDRTVEWEHEYIYWAAIETEVLSADRKIIATVEGADSPQIDVFVHDIFPPAAPTGLEAVSSGTPQQPSIDLSWTPNTEADLAGYNVYRHEQGAAPVKVSTEVLKTPVYRDTTVQPGHHYVYSVTAVDLRGNESAPSVEATETVLQ